MRLLLYSVMLVRSSMKLMKREGITLKKKSTYVLHRLNGYFHFSSPRVQTLLKGLSPAYLRLGGNAADYTVYSNEPSLLNHVLNCKRFFSNSANVNSYLSGHILFQTTTNINDVYDIFCFFNSFGY